MGSAQNNDFNFPHFPPPPPPSAKPPSPSKSSPPPPSQPFAPPPHHVHPPPRPSPSPDNHPTVIVIVFVSFGGLLLLAFLAVALCCYIKKRKKTVQETDLIHFDEERKVKEAIIPGPCGTKAVMLTIEDDVHIDEIIRKNEKVGGGLHRKSAEGISGPHEEGAGASSSSVDHHQLGHKP